MKHVRLALLLLVTGIITSEAILRLYFTIAPAPPNVHDLAYRNSPYYSEAFIAESHAAYNWYIADDGGAVARDYAGQYINITNGIRRTTGTPQTWRGTVHLFGPSTVLNLEVPDNLTIASQLQALLPDYRVINHGAPALVTSVQVDRLEHTALGSGDIVVFYGGISDAVSVYTEAVNKQQGELYYRGCKSLSVLAIYAALCAHTLHDAPSIVYDAPLLKQKAIAVAERYAALIAEARQYTEANGAAFYSVLQPHLWTAPLTPDEQILSDNIPNKGIDTIIVAVWAELETVPHSVNLTHVFDAVRQHEMIYFDGMHVNERGNAIVVRSLYDALRGR